MLSAEWPPCPRLPRTVLVQRWESCISGAPSVPGKPGQAATLRTGQPQAALRVESAQCLPPPCLMTAFFSCSSHTRCARSPRDSGPSVSDPPHQIPKGPIAGGASTPPHQCESLPWGLLRGSPAARTTLLPSPSPLAGSEGLGTSPGGHQVALCGGCWPGRVRMGPGSSASGWRTRSLGFPLCRQRGLTHPSSAWPRGCASGTVRAGTST